MKHVVILLLLFVITAKALAQNAAEVAKVKQTLKGATITHRIVKTKAIFFSNEKKMDTILLTVSAGLISQSKSGLLIKTADNRVVYTEGFQTAYFIRGIFQPATMPQGGAASYEANVNKYILALTKAKFEEYAGQKINGFLKDVSVTNTAIKRAKIYGKVKDPDLYNAVAANPNARAIWFPCFDCEEDGARFFTYSAQKAKTILFLETD